MWSPEVTGLLGAIGAVVLTKTIDRLYDERRENGPIPRSRKYDTAAHAERVRGILRRYVELLPLPALVTLQEVAALLAAGESPKIVLARATLGKPGPVQSSRGKSWSTAYGPRRPPRFGATRPTKP
jgi:hypothetical protein